MNMNEYNYTSAAMESFAAIMTAMILFGYLLERKKIAKTSRLFAWCLAVNTAMLLSDAPILVLLVNPSPERVIPIKILSFFPHVSARYLAVLCLTKYFERRKYRITTHVINLRRRYAVL